MACREQPHIPPPARVIQAGLTAFSFEYLLEPDQIFGRAALSTRLSHPVHPSAVSREGFNKGVNILHSLGGWTCDIVGNRAISQVKVTVYQRATVEDVLVDVSCLGRHYDFFEKRDGRWAIVRRQSIFEKDRMDPVDPSAVLKLDEKLLAAFPEGYRHLAYLQSRIGYKVKDNVPGLRGPALEKLYHEGKAWLAGSPKPGELL